MRKGLWMKGLVLGMIMLFSATIINQSEVITSASNTMKTELIELVINNDGSGDPTDRKVNIPEYLPSSGITPTLTFNFTITGLNNTEFTAFYGDNPWEDWKNISITGDILYPLNGTTLYHVGTKGDWNCYLVPTKPYGTITLRIDWPGNGSANNTVEIVEGCYVTPLVDSFPWGYNFSLTVTVKDMDEASLKYSEVFLIWEEDNLEFNHTFGDNSVGNGRNGKYTFFISKEEQGELATKNITIAVNDPSSGLSGYTKVTMQHTGQPPNPPIIDGPHCGKINTEYLFLLGEITDPEGDQFYCLWDWGDYTTSGWLGPYDSEATIEASHSWSETGTYLIKVKLKDSYGLEGNWSEPFTMYITSKILLMGIIQSVGSQTEACTIFNMSFSFVIQINPFDFKMYSSVQILVLFNEFQGVITTRFIAGRIYALVLNE